MYIDILVINFLNINKQKPKRTVTDTKYDLKLNAHQVST